MLKEACQQDKFVYIANVLFIS